MLKNFLIILGAAAVGTLLVGSINVFGTNQTVKRVEAASIFIHADNCYTVLVENGNDLVPQHFHSQGNVKIVRDVAPNGKLFVIGGNEKVLRGGGYYEYLEIHVHSEKEILGAR